MKTDRGFDGNDYVVLEGGEEQRIHATTTGDFLQVAFLPHCSQRNRFVVAGEVSRV